MSNDEYRAEQQEARQHGLRARQEQRLENAILRADWLAQEDDTIGGWCITDASVPGTPADGNPAIARFTHEGVARHMADVHNAWLTESGWMIANRQKVGRQIARAIKAHRARFDPGSAVATELWVAEEIALEIGEASA